MAIISRPSIPEVVFERVKTDLTEFAFNFFQDGITLDVSARTYKVRLKTSGVNALDKASSTNAAGRVTFALTDAEKTNLNSSEYQFFLVEILAGGGEKTLMAGTLRWSVPFGKPTGLVSAPDVSVNYITATQELMVALGVVDFGSMSSAISAAQAEAAKAASIDAQNETLSLKGEVEQMHSDVAIDAQQVNMKATQVQQAKSDVDSGLASVQQLIAQGFKVKGNWNVGTNTPNIAAASKADGDAYIVKGAGATSISGESIDAADGDVFHWNATDAKWIYRKAATIPASKSVGRNSLDDELIQTVGETEEIAMVNGKKALYIVRDVNKDVIFTIFDDETTSLDTDVSIGVSNGLSVQRVGKSYILGFGNSEGQLPFGTGNVQSEEFLYVNGKRALFVFRDSNQDVVDAYFADGTTLNDPIVTIGAGSLGLSVSQTGKNIQLTGTPANITIGVKNGLKITRTGLDYVLDYGNSEGEAPYGSGVLSTEDIAFVNGKEILHAVLDSNKDVVEAWFKDGTTFSAPVGLAGMISEIAAARGSKLTLNDRIVPVITSNGLPTTPIWGAEFLKRWIAYRRNQDSRFDWILIGDSYTQGNYFSANLRAWLIAEGYLNGGAGWCGFNRWGTSVGSINQAVNSALSVSYTIADWSAGTANNMGVDGYITSLVANTVLTLTATEATASVTLLFERHTGGGDFRYRIGSGSWTVVSTNNATQDTSTVVINTAGSGNSFIIEVEPLAVGIILCGAIGRNTGNVLNVHKCGISGGQASLFGSTALWSTSVSHLSPKGAVIMFGTNEMAANLAPATFKTNVQNIITKLRTADPVIDIILACPTFTKYETEDPRTYSLKDYASVLFQLAQENQAAFINHGLAMGTFSQALVDNGFMHSDRVHPAAKGGYLIADNFFKLLKK
ncbi:SGNH/GDSL hydrolase family protein [Dyadobacter jiangsuensis]